MDSPAERLRKIRRERGFSSARSAAKRFGWHEATYTSHENGTRPLTRAFGKYAAAYRVSEAWLRGLTDDQGSGVRGVPVTGEAAVGVWRETAVEAGPPPNGRVIDIPESEEDVGNVRFCVRVADNSVNRALPADWYAICAPLAVTAPGVQEFRVGDMLYIERTRRGMKEMSLRRVSRTNGDHIRLSTHSTDPKLKQDVTYPSANAGEKVRLVGRVVGKYADYIPD